MSCQYQGLSGYGCGRPSPCEVHPKPTVNIIDTEPGAIQVYADAVLVTDRVFDTHGGTHALEEVRHMRRLIRAGRVDGWLIYFEPDDIVTVLSAEQRGRAIDRESSGSRQGYIETGRYSTVDEEREYNG